MSAKRPKKSGKLGKEEESALQFQSERHNDPGSTPDPATNPVPDVKVPETEPPEVPQTPIPDVVGDTNPGGAQIEPLSEREKYLVSITTKQVLNQIDPLLIKLQQISNEAVSMGAQQKLQELERGINERIESRINKINALIGRRGG